MEFLIDLVFPTSRNKHKAYLLKNVVYMPIVIGLVLAHLIWFIREDPFSSVKGLQTNLTEDRIIDLTNQKRVEAGLDPVSQNNILSQAAQLKAENMVEANVFDHYYEDSLENSIDPWQFILSAGYDYFYAGENLGKDFTDSEVLVQAWYDSPTHRDNLLNPRYKDIGVAVIHGPFLDKEETTLIVQLFATTTEAAITDQMIQVEASEKGSISTTALLEQEKSIFQVFVQEYPGILFASTLGVTLVLGIILLIDVEVAKRKDKDKNISIDLWNH